MKCYQQSDTVEVGGNRYWLHFWVSVQISVPVCLLFESESKKLADLSYPHPWITSYQPLSTLQSHAAVARCSAANPSARFISPLSKALVLIVPPVTLFLPRSLVSCEKRSKIGCKYSWHQGTWNRVALNRILSTGYRSRRSQQAPSAYPRIFQQLESGWFIWFTWQ